MLFRLSTVLLAAASLVIGSSIEKREVATCTYIATPNVTPSPPDSDPSSLNGTTVRNALSPPIPASLTQFLPSTFCSNRSTFCADPTFWDAHRSLSQDQTLLVPTPSSAQSVRTATLRKMWWKSLLDGLGRPGMDRGRESSGTLTTSSVEQAY
ncbi:hypothetical protein NMY22_g3563 [Coprinellus aureogranulatus]|nr:hypothetical protein NMY22_g3563 [Coprinellus aureogranulatus]